MAEEYIILKENVDTNRLEEVASLNTSQFKSKKVEYKRAFVGIEGETIEEVVLNKAQKHSAYFSQVIVIVRKRTYEYSWLAIPSFSEWETVGYFISGQQIGL